MSNPKFTPGQIIHKVGGRYGGPGRYVGETMELDDDGYRLHNVAMKVEGGYGEFVHVFPASALSDAPDTRATTPTASELVEAPEYYSDDPNKLKRLLAQRDKFIVDHGLWASFVAALSNIGEAP